MSGLDSKFQAILEGMVTPKDPFELIDKGVLYIRAIMPTGRIQLLKFWPETMTPPQARLYKRIKTLYYEGKPIRIRILKARQMGFSTLLQAIIFSFSVVRPLTNALVLSYRTKSATWLFGMQKLFQEEIEKRKEYPIEPLVKSNEKKIEWKNTHSEIGIDTEGSPNVALTETRSMALLTEYAYYTDPVTLWDNLIPSIQLLPGTMIFIETTANGVGNQFYQEWKAGESGKGGFENFFFPWTDHPMYVFPAENISKYDQTDENKAYKACYNLTDEQYSWYLTNLYDQFRGDREAMAEKYPASADEAFRAPGGIVFKTLGPLLQAEEPRLKGEGGMRGRMEQTGTTFVFKPGAGSIEIIKHPVPGRLYAAYSDVGEGLKGEVMENQERVDTTYSTVIVRDASTEELCAIMECRYPIDVFADEAESLCRYYNEALWGVEIPGPGFGVIGRVMGRYPNLYRAEWLDPDKQFRKSAEYGYRNSPKTKPLLEADWEAFIREEPSRIGSIRLIGQALTYIINQRNGKHEPKPGCFSDLLLADFGCVQMLKACSKSVTNPKVLKSLRSYTEQRVEKKRRRWKFI